MAPNHTIGRFSTIHWTGPRRRPGKATASAEKAAMPRKAICSGMLPNGTKT